MEQLLADLDMPGANKVDINRQIKQLQVEKRRQTNAKKAKENIPLYHELLAKVQRTHATFGNSTLYKSFSNETSASSELAVNLHIESVENYCKRTKVFYTGSWSNTFKLEIRLLRANCAPPGMVRHMLLNDFLLIQDLSDNDYIVVEACGNVNGSFFALLQMYQRMGFQYVGSRNELMHTQILQKNAEAIDLLAPDQQLNPYFSHAIFAQPIKTFKLWCTHFVHLK
jgi:hypothetical protein